MKQGHTIIGAPPPPPLEGEVADEESDAPASEVRELAPGPQQHGERLDRVLAQLVPEFSRSYLQQLVEGGAVAVDGRAATRPAHRVRAGSRLTIELRPTPQSQAFRPEPIPLQVVHEDEHLLVVDKPAGLVVHPAPGNWSGTLLNALLGRDPAAAQLPRAGIVHRLDKDTSGLMVVARTRPVMDALVRAIAARDVSRQYLAIAQGRWSGPPQRLVEAPIGRDPRNRLRMAAVDLAYTPGKAAATTFDLLDATALGCLVQATLHTGRTHQIRVHLAHLGLPLLGDVLYGGRTEAGMARQALHAFRLALRHPVTGELLDLRSPLPADLAAALQTWGLRYNPGSASALAATPVATPPPAPGHPTVGAPPGARSRKTARR